VGSVTTAVLVTSLTELAIAQAVISHRLFDGDTLLVVASTAEAAEVDHPVLDAAAGLAGPEVSVIDLNAVIAPLHPLGWRRADQSAEAFTERWRAAGAPADVDRLVVMSGPSVAAQAILAELLGLSHTRVAWFPDAAGTWQLRAREVIALDAPAGLVRLAPLTRRRTVALPASALAAAWQQVAAAEVGAAPWRRAGLVRWLIAMLAALRRPRPAVTTVADDDAAPTATLAFVATTIATLDHQLTAPVRAGREETR
jgi:hypothetical protein